MVFVPEISGKEKLKAWNFGLFKGKQGRFKKNSDLFSIQKLRHFSFSL